MNTHRTETARQAPASSRLAAGVLASVMTLAMLLGVNTLATADAPAAQLAQQQAAQTQQPA